MTAPSVAIQWIAVAFEWVGVGVIVVGFMYALWRTVEAGPGRGAGDRYSTLRAVFGRAVLLGLEVLVAADIIRTVALEPNLNNLAILAGLVVIRTFLSWSLTVEIDGRWPWQAAGVVPADATTQPPGD